MGTLTTSSSRGGLAGRIMYGGLFVVVLPAMLAWWAHATRAFIHLPAMHDRLWGATVAAAGVGTILAGMVVLWRRGGGLPMNAFPPQRLVSTGIYAMVPHPIYGGFVIACAGVAVYSGSASGLWLVTPAVALGCAALVLGYELPDLRARFGPSSGSVWLSQAGPGAPTLVERLRIYLVVLLPWLVGYELISALGQPAHSISTWSRFDARIPVIEATELVYGSIYLVVLLAPLLIRSSGELRAFAIRGLSAMAFIFPLYLVLPLCAPPRAFDASSLFAALLSLERQPGSEMGAFPSFHVVWACMAASALGGRSRPGKTLAWAWAILVAVSCATTGMHSIADIVAGFVAYFVVAHLGLIWTSTLGLAERIANSWREWCFGPVRVINHGAYAGSAAAAGILIIGSLAGPGRAGIALGICVCSLIGAALWAQWVEGSPVLLRPLGFYGGMLGGIAGAGAAYALHISVWTVLAALAVAAPWIQAVGRLRCLVQGCCHGHAAESVPGIRYSHARSRVCRLAHLAGVPVHATPVYSILWNVLSGAAIIRVAQSGASSAMICGIYMLLSGSGRFVEEAYRGEPQTRIMAGLRFYQWIAFVCVAAGAVMTCMPGSAPFPAFSIQAGVLLAALAGGALTWFVSGVDFPESNRRFSRLT